MIDKTLELIERKLQMWLEAEDKVALGQSYTIDGQQLTRADLTKIAERINYWTSKKQEHLNGGSGFRFYQGVPL